MKRGRTPFTAKLKPEMQPQVVDDPKGRGPLLLPTPLLVAAEIAKIARGKVITASELRARLASAFAAKLACPLMTGIFFNLVAGAAEEQLEAGQKPLAPYWRVVMDKGILSPKTPFGPERQALRLRAEGREVEEQRGKWRLTEFPASSSR